MCRRVKKSIKNSGKSKIVIVGGSHSAFSAAWMCINHLDNKNSNIDNNYNNNYNDKNEIVQYIEVNKQCKLNNLTCSSNDYTCNSSCSCEDELHINTPNSESSEADTEKDSTYTDSPRSPVRTNSSKGTSSSNSSIDPRSMQSVESGIDFINGELKQLSHNLNHNLSHNVDTIMYEGMSEEKGDTSPKSYPNGKYVNTEKDKIKDKNTTNSTNALQNNSSSSSSGSSMGANSVLILHRSAIKVFYSTKKEADSDSYTDIGMVNKGTGQIHPFGGLRGDSKALWR